MDSERASSASTRDQTDLTPDERIGFLFQPDSLLSAHYFWDSAQKDPLRAGEEAHVGDLGRCHSLLPR